MKYKKYFIPVIVFFFATILLLSCNLKDFNLKKLSKVEDIVPDIFAPLAYGTFKVSDLVILPGQPNNFQIPYNGYTLDPLIVSKLGTSFTSAAIDSVYLIINFNNDTPCDMIFELRFVNAKGVQIGQSFPSKTIPTGSKDFNIPFNLGPADQDNLMNSSGIKLNFTIFSPPSAANLILYQAVKNTSFTFNISFHAHVNLQKL